ncbi:MAG: hypothetical protein QME64_07400, partial [bacterium]|nr:hypothetical protein [bacterium]
MSQPTIIIVGQSIYKKEKPRIPKWISEKQRPIKAFMRQWEVLEKESAIFVLRLNQNDTVAQHSLQPYLKNYRLLSVSTSGNLFLQKDAALYLHNLITQMTIPVKLSVSEVSGLGLSPDVQYILFQKSKTVPGKGYQQLDDGRWLEGILRDLYIAKVDDSEIRRLTPYLSDSYLASWSPNGKYIAFSYHTCSNQQYNEFFPTPGYLEGWNSFLRIVRPDGAVIAEAILANAYIERMKWTNDSRTVNVEVWRTPFTDLPPFSSGSLPEAFAPLAEPLVIGNLVGFPSAIYVLDLKGKLRLLARKNYQLSIRNPSPDGTKVIFDSISDQTFFSLITAVLQMPFPKQDLRVPWSWWIQEISFAGTGRDVFVANRDGSRVLNLTAQMGVSDQRDPKWLPDRQSILFVNSSYYEPYTPG